MLFERREGLPDQREGVIVLNSASKKISREGRSEGVKTQ